MRRKYGYYEYEVQPWGEGWGYKIYTSNPDYYNIWETEVYRESEEWFDSEAQAGFAAVGHIALLENGEG